MRAPLRPGVGLTIGVAVLVVSLSHPARAVRDVTGTATAHVLDIKDVKR